MIEYLYVIILGYIVVWLSLLDLPDYIVKGKPLKTFFVNLFKVRKKKNANNKS